jgi:hypothetical protein
MPSSGRGVIYTAIREQFVDEARISAQSVRRFLPEARIVLFTDLQLERTDPFDEVIRLTSLSAKPHLDKLHCIRFRRSPRRCSWTPLPMSAASSRNCSSCWPSSISR